jgi:hypothetical protein
MTLDEPDSSPDITEPNSPSKNQSTQRLQIYSKNNSKKSIGPFTHSNVNSPEKFKEGSSHAGKAKKKAKKDILKNIDSLEKALY